MFIVAEYASLSYKTRTKNEPTHTMETTKPCHIGSLRPSILTIQNERKKDILLVRLVYLI